MTLIHARRNAMIRAAFPAYLAGSLVVGAALTTVTTGCSTVKSWFGGGGAVGLDDEEKSGNKTKKKSVPASSLSGMEGEEGGDYLSAEDLADDEEDGRLGIPSTVEADDGLLVRITVRVDKDKKSVAFDYLGDVEQLEWDGNGGDTGARNYFNDRFKATVTFPNDARDAAAVVARK